MTSPTTVPPLPVEAIVGEFGTPIYTFEEARLRAAYRDFGNAFSRVGLPFKIAYSYKTNPLTAVLETMSDLGAYAEVVSGRELTQALSLGIGGDRIIFNGPLKTDAELRLAIAVGALINLDSFHELRRLRSVIDDNGCRARVGARVVFSSESGSWSKFGFDYESGEFATAVQALLSEPRMAFESIHCHIRSNLVVLSEYASSMRRVFGVWDEVAPMAGDLQILNIGSGFPSTSPALATIEGAWSPPLIYDYARILEELTALIATRPPRSLTIEPGRALVGRPGSLLTRVVSVKKRNGRSLIIVDAGVNMIPGLPMYRYDMRVAGTEAPQSAEVHEVHGSLCESLDVLGEVRGVLSPGDSIVVTSVGAYDMASRSFDFIRAVPGVVWIYPDGRRRLVREPQSRDPGRSLRLSGE